MNILELKPKYQIFETENYTKGMQRVCSASEEELLDRKSTRFIYRQLRAEPRWGPRIKKLAGFSPETYRYQINNFRLFYTLDEKEKCVVLLAFRKTD